MSICPHPSVPPQLHSQQCSILCPRTGVLGHCPLSLPSALHGRSLSMTWNRGPSTLPPALKSPIPTAAK